jgi:hypothetical protein
MFECCNREGFLQWLESLRPFELSRVLQNARAGYDYVRQHNCRSKQGAERHEPALIFRKIIERRIVKTMKPKD